jgi:hypothetical protein
MVSAPGTQAVLIGSGVSRSAQVLTGWEVTLDLVRRLAAMEGAKETPDLEAWYTGTYGKPPDYSDLLLSLAKTAAERRSLLQGYFEPTEVEREVGAKSPTPAHRAIARLVAQGFVRVILTTNFDRLMETALRDEGVEPIVVSTADGTEGAAPIVHQRCLVVKLHGDYLDDRIKNTEVELGMYDPRMDHYLDRILDEFGLIICGWSGEWDPALRAALERCKSRRYTTTWVSMSSPGPRADYLISLRAAQVVVTTGADSFFVSLAEKVASVVELNMTSPASVGTAVATLKRYLAEDRHRIRLDDLILDEINKLRKQLRAELLATGAPPPTSELIAQRVHQIDAWTELVRVIFFHGCRLATAPQEAGFVSALALMAHREQMLGAYYSEWLEATRYPSICILYAGAFGALVSENWSLLRKLLLLQIRSEGRERTACDHLAAYHSDELGQHLRVNQWHRTPASDHLVDILIPLCDGLRPDPDTLFDELEVWMSLAYLDSTLGIKYKPGMVPPGRFLWRGNGRADAQPSRLINQASKLGLEWPPLKAGWFGGQRERWEQVKAAFIEWVQHQPWR